MKEALQLSLEALSAEQTDGTPETLMIAQRLVATTYTYLGDLAPAQALYDRAMAWMDSDRCREASTQYLADQRIAALYQYSLMRCLQGHVEHSRHLMDRAHSLCVPVTPALQKGYLYLLGALRAAVERDHAMVAAERAALVDVGTKHRMLPWFDGYADVLSAWKAMDSGQPTDPDIERFQRGLEKLEASGQRLFLPSSWPAWPVACRPAAATRKRCRRSIVRRPSARRPRRAGARLKSGACAESFCCAGSIQRWKLRPASRRR